VSVPTSQPIAAASAAMARAQLEELARAAPARRRRRIVRLVDGAIDGCELLNLSGGPGRPAPAEARLLVEWLQLEAGEPVEQPTTSGETLNELFRLQEAYLLTDPSGAEQIELDMFAGGAA
jgi:hypothetical protein